jgi:hypothetical protein
VARFVVLSWNFPEGTGKMTKNLRVTVSGPRFQPDSSRHSLDSGFLYVNAKQVACECKTCENVCDVDLPGSVATCGLYNKQTRVFNEIMALRICHHPSLHLSSYHCFPSYTCFHGSPFCFILAFKGRC